MKVFTTLKDMSRFHKDTHLDMPFVVNAGGVLGMDCLKSEESKVVQTMKHWLQAYPTNRECVLHDNTQAPLHATHGASLLEPVWHSVTPVDCLVKACSIMF